MKENLIQDDLKDAQDFTAVEKFSITHDLQQIPSTQRVYKDLIPKSTPGPGQQYAFEVNLDQCSGCKACITACHNENGLEDDETWRSVGLIHGGTSQSSVIQHITTACHHCLDPACLNGCPVKAYEKDPSTGIVRHLEDQCIGCQYCTFTCAYDVPKYNKKKGIVHKCDMCISRLNVGEAPACVRACPGSAIRITLVDVDTVKRNPNGYVHIPQAPDSHYTLPTTRYIRKQEFPANMQSADFYTLQPEHSHWPLIVMLVLTQLSVGAFGIGIFLEHYLGERLQSIMPYHLLVALGMAVLALGSSIFHLGRPLYAFRCVLGLKRSWLSREILAFTLFAILATWYALSYWLHSMSGLRDGIFAGGEFQRNQFIDILSFSTLVVGCVGVFCSAMVYKVTRRPFWDHAITIVKFFMTTGILGISSVLGTLTIFSLTSKNTALFSVQQQMSSILYLTLAIMTLIKMLLESGIFLHLSQNELTSLKKTALLMIGPLRAMIIWRFVSSFLGGIVLSWGFLHLQPQVHAKEMIGISTLIFVFTLVGEFLERYLFFRAVVPLQMPEMKS